MKKILSILIAVFAFSTGYAQSIIFTGAQPKYGCPNTTHDVIIGVKNNSGQSVPNGASYTVTATIFDDLSSQFYTNSQSFTNGVNNQDTVYITLPNVTFTGAMVCSVDVQLSYTIPIPPYTGTYSTNGTYTVQPPPTLVITENPTGTVEVQTPLDGYSVRYYLDASSTYINQNTTTTYTPVSNSGVYTAKAFDVLSMCLSQSASNGVTISVAASTLEAQKFKFSVYPNPMISSVTISSVLSNSLVYELSDVLGAIQKFSGFNSSTQVDVSGLNAGVYTLSIKENGKVIATYKLMK